MYLLICLSFHKYMFDCDLFYTQIKNNMFLILYVLSKLYINMIYKDIAKITKWTDVSRVI